MTKEVIVTISSVQNNGAGESEQYQSKAEGIYHFKNDSHYIQFEEKQEGFTETTKTVLNIRKDFIRMTKKGLIQTQMVFQKGEDTPSDYQTPYGKLPLTIHTEKLKVEECSEDRLVAAIRYRMESLGDFLSACDLTIEVKSK